ncbi:unnamed protein product [Heterotrigona itama]|uniref:Uncharacterized protein n=1 Tax=Heterotrigona itama TaxID=395501 RepID=A0A6V7H4Q4_9HYME|nr:unnamed protein product [Heterotrigona itama]
MATHRNSLNFTLWNAISVKNKTIELHKFLIDHNIDIATWNLTSSNCQAITFTGKMNPSLLQTNQEKGYSSQAIFKDISQPTSLNIEYISIKLKTTSRLIIGTAYVASKNKINQTDIDNIILLFGTGHIWR